MKHFTIDTENAVTAYAEGEQIPEGHEQFSTEKELSRLAATWPSDRLIEVWNGFAGVVPFADLKPVKKFTDRKTAVARIWKAIQKLEAAPAPQTPTVAPKAAQEATVATKAAKAPRKPAGTDGAPTAREGSKKAIVLELIRRSEGASLKEIMAATSWQSHSVRGFISGSLTKKLGLNIQSFKRENGERAYRLPGE